MSCRLIDRGTLADPSWWHWTATIPFLILHLNGMEWAIGAAAGLCVVAMAYFLNQTRAMQPYPVQIRMAYLMWLMAGLLPWMEWMHWIQLAGTSAMVTVGYCPLARLLNLLPFNRSEPFTWSLVGRVFFRGPCVGGLVRWSGETDPPQACCSIRTPSADASRPLSYDSPVQENQHAAAY